TRRTQRRSAWSRSSPATVATDLRAEAAAVNWFHSIELEPGFVTPGRADTSAQIPRLHLPDLRGKSVLDVGAWDGYFSFEAERQGAARVVALDTWVWRENKDRPPRKRGFDIAREALGSTVEACVADFTTVDLDELGVFDVVLF